MFDFVLLILLVCLDTNPGEVGQSNMQSALSLPPVGRRSSNFHFLCVAHVAEAKWEQVLSKFRERECASGATPCPICREGFRNEDQVICCGPVASEVCPKRIMI